MTEPHFQRMCVVLIVLQAAAVLALLLSLFSLSHAGYEASRYCIIGIAAVSAVLGIVGVAHGAVTRQAAIWGWALALLVFNVVPYALLLVTGQHL